MSDADITPLHPRARGFRARRARRRARRAARPRIRKLRLLALAIPLSALALISTIFGMMMAVASDLPQISLRYLVRHSTNSVLYDDQGRQIGILTTNESRIVVPSKEISPWIKSAVIGVEDKRFYTNSGVDLRGIARAFVEDVVQGKAAQGASTIAQQLVKNALAAQDNRTIFEKLREAALAWHLTKRWTKDQILTDYLNTIYFGNGAYGIESAARTYFGDDPKYNNCGVRLNNPCASLLQPSDAALLAGLIASPSGYDPVRHPIAAKNRRNLVLHDMLQQGNLTPAEYRNAIAAPLWSGRLEPPSVSIKAPYFATWVREQLIDKFGPDVVEQGLKVHTTLDLSMQTAAQNAVNAYLASPTGPQAALVAIDNSNGEVRAMVGGSDYNTQPFNLATQGQRQPGSAFKPFDLAQALKEGISPGSVWPSEPRVFHYVVHTKHGNVPGVFHVGNIESTYVGQRTLTNALEFSDNTVFAAVGIKAGVKRIARLAHRMGIRTPLSTFPALTLGAPKVGVTPLDMAHAYETFAESGQRVDGTLGSGTSDNGPVGIIKVSKANGGKVLARNHPRFIRVLNPALDQTEVQMLEGVVQVGTAKNAAWGGFAAGKTGTTENYHDAWFVGFTHDLTVAVWVGYPSGSKSMATDYQGGPVEGGTYPSLIWRDFIEQAQSILTQERAKAGIKPKAETTTDVAPLPGGGVATGPVGTTTAPAAGGATTPTQAGGTTTPAVTPTPTPAQTPAPSPTPTPTPTPAGGGGAQSGGVGAPPG